MFPADHVLGQEKQGEEFLGLCTQAQAAGTRGLMTTGGPRVYLACPEHQPIQYNKGKVPGIPV